MAIRFSVENHPDTWVRTYGPSATGEYLRGCWAPCLPQTTARLVRRAARAADRRPEQVEFWQEVWPDLDDRGYEIGEPPPEVQYAIAEAEALHLGEARYGSFDDVDFTLYRQVPFVPERRIGLLSPEALETHAVAVRDTNRRLQSAGRRTVEVPGWVIHELDLENRPDFTARDIQGLVGEHRALAPPVHGQHAGPEGAPSGPTMPQALLDGLSRSAAPPPDLSL